MRPVTCDEVRAVWPSIALFIEQACERGPLGGDPDIIRDRCISRDNSLFVFERDSVPIGAVVMGLHVCKGRDVAEFIACGGVDWSSWGEYRRSIEQWARENGCTAMRLIGRVGWIKRFTDYRITGHILEKEL